MGLFVSSVSFINWIVDENLCDLKREVNSWSTISLIKSIYTTQVQQINKPLVESCVKQWCEIVFAKLLDLYQ